MASLSSPSVALPTDEIMNALRSAAQPGFTGCVRIELQMKPSAVECVTYKVSRRTHQNVSGPQTTTQDLPDVTRAKPVQRCVEAIHPKLVIRPGVYVIQANYTDGVLRNWELED